MRTLCCSCRSLFGGNTCSWSVSAETVPCDRKESNVRVPMSSRSQAGLEGHMVEHFERCAGLQSKAGNNSSSAPKSSSSSHGPSQNKSSGCIADTLCSMSMPDNSGLEGPGTFAKASKAIMPPAGLWDNCRGVRLSRNPARRHLKAAPTPILRALSVCGLAVT